MFVKSRTAGVQKIRFSGPIFKFCIFCRCRFWGNKKPLHTVCVTFFSSGYRAREGLGPKLVKMPKEVRI